MQYTHIQNRFKNHKISSISFQYENLEFPEEFGFQIEIQKYVNTLKINKKEEKYTVDLMQNVQC